KPAGPWIGLIFWWVAALLFAAPVSAEDGSAIKRWEWLSPQEQERVLKNYEAWKRLSPDEQHRVQENLEQFRRMPRQDRERVRQNYRRFQQLPPERQNVLRQRFERFKQLSPEERASLKERIETRREQQGKGERQIDRPGRKENPHPRREHPGRK